MTLSVNQYHSKKKEFSMNNRIICLSALVLSAGGTYCAQKPYTKQRAENTPGGISEKRCRLRTNMRKLWSDHVWWTRNYLIAAIADMPELKDTTARLLKNQEDIGDAIASYYGKKAGKELTTLLKEHILIAADVVSAAKSQDNAALKTANDKWYANADAIAEFLSTANPNWPYKAVQSMLYKHLKLTTDEATARLKQQWKTDINIFDRVFDEIMEMADTLTNGIVKQFPDKF
jgi:hypothetical protein